MHATLPLITTDGRANLCEIQCRNYERRQRYTPPPAQDGHTEKNSPHKGKTPGSGTGSAA